MKFLPLLLLLLPQVLLAQKVEFELQGEFNLSRHYDKMIISVEGKRDTLDFPSNGKFNYKGSVSVPKRIMIWLDSANILDIWADSGLISFQCEDRAWPDQPRAKIVSLKGPADSELYDQLEQKEYVVHLPSGTTRASIYKSAYNLIDSLIRLRPLSKVIPNYILYHKSNLGPVVVNEFYQRLPESTKNSKGGKDVLNYLQRSSLLKVGTTVEDFSMPQNNGNTFRLSSLNNDFILLNFWASWCGPCRVEHPELVRVYNEFHSKGFSIVSISLDENTNDWLKAIKKDNLAWANVSDLKGPNSELALKYNIYSLPFNVLLDKNKKVIAQNVNPYGLEEILNRYIVQ